MVAAELLQVVIVLTNRNFFLLVNTSETHCFSDVLQSMDEEKAPTVYGMHEEPVHRAHCIGAYR